MDGLLMRCDNNFKVRGQPLGKVEPRSDPLLKANSSNLNQSKHFQQTIAITTDFFLGRREETSPCLSPGSNSIYLSDSEDGDLLPEVRPGGVKA